MRRVRTDPESGPDSGRVSAHDRGQTLVFVAITLLVMLLFAALAVDVGEWYAERRRLQNAADAGALAGARQMCFNPAYSSSNTGIATTEAVRVAQANGAATVTAQIWDQDGKEESSGNVVYVSTSAVVQTRFARAIGLGQVTVAAEAAAACGVATSGCGFWPIAFDWDIWQYIDPGDEFYVWDDDTVGQNLCQCCECAAIPDGTSSTHIGPGQRGWLTLSAPDDPFEVPSGCGNVNNCGADALKCWLEYLYPGSIRLEDCIPGQSGVVGSALDKASTQEGNIVNIIIYDNDTSGCTADNTLGTCPGTLYHVEALGCVEIIKVFYKGSDKLTLQPLDEEDWPDGVDCSDVDCPKNAKAIQARKLDPAMNEECPPTNCGTTTGAPVVEGAPSAVSLIPIPVSDD